MQASNPEPGAGAGDRLGIINQNGLVYRGIACDDQEETRRLWRAQQDLGLSQHVARSVARDMGFQYVFDREPRREPFQVFRPGGHRSRR